MKKYGLKWNKTYIPFKLFENFSEYYMMIGERSDGKTYIIMEMMLYLYINYGYCGALIRRWETDIKGEFGRKQIDNLIGDNDIVIQRTKGKYHNAVEEISGGKYHTIVYKSRAFYLATASMDEKGNVMYICADKPFMYAFAISQEEHNKGGGLSRIKIILFDEFITRDSYIVDEFVSFMNLLSTIIRRRNDVTIFLCGNTISRYSIYFEEMGLKHLKSQQFGSIDVYEYTIVDKKTHKEQKAFVQVELIDFVGGEHKTSNKYFCFDNPKIRMITDGKWEISIYPRLPEPIKPMYVKFKYFIRFDGETFMCEIVKSPTNKFTFIHPFTKEIVIDKNTIIFDLDCEISLHHRKRITKPYDDIGKLIASYFAQDKVCYSSNAVGETIRTYIEMCAN